MYCSLQEATYYHHKINTIKTITNLQFMIIDILWLSTTIENSAVLSIALHACSSSSSSKRNQKAHEWSCVKHFVFVVPVDITETNSYLISLILLENRFISTGAVGNSSNIDTFLSLVKLPKLYFRKIHCNHQYWLYTLHFEKWEQIIVDDIGLAVYI